MIALRVARVHDPQVGVFPGAARRGVSNFVAVARPWAKTVARFSVGKKSNRGCSHVVAIELIPFASPDIFRKNDVIAAVRVETGDADRILEEGELATLSPGQADEVQLWRFGEAGIDQNGAFHGMPVDETPQLRSEEHTSEL